MIGQIEQYYGTGKRKTAVARVFLRKGSGNFNINKRTLEKYFPIDVLRKIIMMPFEITGTVGKFDIYATIKGGGITAQAEALRHGISKALLEYNPAFREKLKKAGFLRRDARMKERKKYGQRGARARFQFSKR